MTLFSNFSIDEDLKDTLKSQGIHIPEYNIFEDEEAFQFEEKTYINKNLIPVIEFKITVNKESLYRHEMEWKNLFAHHYGKVLSCPSKWDLFLMQRYLRDNIWTRFRKYIMQPMLKIQEELLETEDTSKLS